jgi:hypothetical protein
MAIDLAFRKAAVRQLTTSVGVYVLCDLDERPIYVGQSTDGIRARVARHLTSARSDIIANRQIDVWEIAWVWAYPITDNAVITSLECALFHHFNNVSPLMNGKIPPVPFGNYAIPPPTQRVQVMRAEEIAEKLDPAIRLPRQAEHYSALVGHFLAVKNSKEIARAMQAHFSRLTRYHNFMLGIATEEE